MFFTFEEFVFLSFGSLCFLIAFCMIFMSSSIRDIKWFLASITPIIFGVIMVSHVTKTLAR